MDGTVVLEPVLKNLPAQGAVEWSEGCHSELERPYSASGLRPEKRAFL